MAGKSRTAKVCLALVLLLIMPLIFSFSSGAKGRENNAVDAYNLAGSYSADKQSSGGGGGVYESLSELNGKRIAVKQGTYFDKIVEESLEGPEIIYFPTTADLINSLKSNKADAFAAEEPALRMMIKADPSITYVSERMDFTDFGFAFSKTDEGRQLNEEFSEFIRKCRQDGTLPELEDIWFGDDESRMVTEDYEAFPDTRGTITQATEGGYEPFSFVKNGKPAGYDIDLASRF